MKRLFSRGPRRKESKSSKAAASPKKGGFGFKSSSSVSSAGSTPTIQEDSVATTTTPVPVNVTIGRSSKIKQLRDQAVTQLEDLLAEKLEGKAFSGRQIHFSILIVIVAVGATL